MTPLPNPTARSWLVGRSPECDRVATGDGVSARHCRLTATAGGLVVEDLGSTNGTFVIPLTKENRRLQQATVKDRVR
jgi:hypothetical protein